MTNPNPMPVGWWLHSNGNAMRVVFDDRTVGEESSVPILAYSEKGVCHWYHPASFVRRLPDDAGFDWKPEPEYPQYWTAYDRHLAYLRRDSDGTHVCVKFDGAESEQCDWYAIQHSGRTRLTKAEAEARIVKPAPIPEIVFDHKTFTSDWGPFSAFSPESLTASSQHPDRWFIWSDDRYPIAFVKHADGKVQNLNVDSILKQSDDWNQGYEDQLTNGELVEVTEFSAKAFLKRPRSASQIPKHEPPKPNRIPVRLYWYDGNVVARFAHSPPTDPSFVEIKLDPERHISDSGFYIEGTGT